MMHAFGCGQAPPARGSTPAARTTPAIDAGSDATSKRAPLVQGFLPVGKVSASIHALGASGGEVLASDAEGLRALLEGDAVPEGFTLIEKHAATGTYAMTRTGRTWRFGAQDAAGKDVLDGSKDGATARACAACHADAPREGYFPPR